MKARGHTNLPTLLYSPINRFGVRTAESLSDPAVAAFAVDQRVIVFIESGRMGIPWLRPAFQNFQETPYTFHRPDELSCRPNRGGTEGSLFLLGHWIDAAPAPKPSNATVVDGYDFLLDRATRCARERGHCVVVCSTNSLTHNDIPQDECVEVKKKL